jgi:glycosyltransferase involved in cell wall biosynthesis
MLRRLAPKAVFAQLDTPNTLGAVAALLADIPRAVLSFRNFSPRHFSYLANDWYLPAYRAAVVSPRVVLSGNSHVANDDYAQWIGLPAAAIACIPNAIDVDSLSRPAEDALQRLREEIGLPEAAPLIVGVFRLSEEKQPHVFLEVCKRLHREFPALRVAIAGIGPLLAEVERTRDVMGLTDVVKLLGRRDDVPAIMSIASLVLLTSTLEGMPNVLLEAQALGVPVVATRVGGVPDCVEHGRTGFVVASEDADGLVGACRRLLLDPALARSMGHSGAKLMRESYSIAALAERHLALAGAKQVAPSDAVSDGETHEAL